ncbi:MAG: hypothetical protein O2816_07450 [Planctomycetota bacterium]|nr:hypothetical protein [Planctomycetota bacterium]
MKRLLLAPLCLAACVSSSTVVDVEGEDHTSAGWELRARLPSTASRWEVFVTGRKGDDTQELRLGETLDLGGADLDGPQTVNSELALRTYGAAYHHPLTQDPRYGVEVIGGFAIADTALDVHGASQSVDLDLHEPYALLGLEAWYALTDQVTGWYRIELPVLSTHTSVGSTEIGAALRLGEVSLSLAWRHTQLEIDRIGSDVDYVLSGPVFGIRVGW